MIFKNGRKVFQWNDPYCVLSLCPARPSFTKLAESRLFSLCLFLRPCVVRTLTVPTLKIKASESFLLALSTVLSTEQSPPMVPSCRSMLTDNATKDKKKKKQLTKAGTECVSDVNCVHVLQCSHLYRCLGTSCFFFNDVCFKYVKSPTLIQQKRTDQ